MSGQQISAIAFEGSRQLAIGPVSAVARAVRDRLGQQADISVLVLDAHTSAAIDLDLRGTPDEVEQRYRNIAQEDDTPDTVKSIYIDTQVKTDAESSRRGRPRLGVVPREVTLLPRHWSWLSSQPGGASATLRRLVEHARAASVEKDRSRDATDATYRFLMHLAGNEIGFEEATRALFANERERFLTRIAQWPEDIREHAERLAEPVFVLSLQPPGKSHS